MEWVQHEVELVCPAIRHALHDSRIQPLWDIQCRILPGDLYKQQCDMVCAYLYMCVCHDELSDVYDRGMARTKVTTYVRFITFKRCPLEQDI